MHVFSRGAGLRPRGLNMNYQESLKYLNSFINYEKTPPKSHAELNLLRMRHGLDVLGHPEKNFFPILITGTVGKGSTGYFLEQILESSKISTGFYHSPHIDDIRERIRVRGEMLSEKKWSVAVTEIQKLLHKNPFPKKLGSPTFFEMLTLLAIWIYAKEGLRVGIFEIGMGGRLDATNVLEAPLCIITKIDFDHQAFLGNTLTKIAHEKAGIIKSACFVVSAPQAQEAMNVFEALVAAPVLGAKRRGLIPAVSPSTKLIISKATSSQPGLAGEFQKQNAGNAVAAAEILAEHFDFRISKKNIREGLKQKNWFGRVELGRWGKREILMDAAHNIAGCRELTDAISRMKKKPQYLLFSALKDKQSADMLKVLSQLDIPIIVMPLSHVRSKNLADLAAEAESFFDQVIPAKNSAHALEILEKIAKPAERVLVTGSFYLLGEMRKILNPNI